MSTSVIESNTHLKTRAGAPDDPRLSDAQIASVTAFNNAPIKKRVADLLRLSQRCTPSSEENWPQEYAEFLAEYQVRGLNSVQFAATLRELYIEHKAYEEGLGTCDTKWAEWYANKIVESGEFNSVFS